MPIERLAVVAAVQTAKHGAQDSANATSNFHGYNMSNAAAAAAGGRHSNFETNLHGNVNILLGGAMMSGVIIVVVLMCYCCHRNVRKNRGQEYSQYCRAEPDLHSLQVFTMDSHTMQCCDQSNAEESTISLPCPSTPGPPPPYDTLIFDPRSLPSPSADKDQLCDPGYILLVHPEDVPPAKIQLPVKEDEELPSYEAALKLEAHGYV